MVQNTKVSLLMMLNMVKEGSLIRQDRNLLECLIMAQKSVESFTIVKTKSNKLLLNEFILILLIFFNFQCLISEI